MTVEPRSEDGPSIRFAPTDEAIERHAPFDWRTRYDVEAADELLESGSTHAHTVSVLAVDIRRSNRLALEIDPPTFARIMKEFIDFSWVAVRSLGAWFDKFTGDGFLAYRPHGSHVEGDRNPTPAGAPSPTLAGVVFLADYIGRYFNETTRQLLRRSARNWPSDAGIAIGVDSGGCNQTFIGDDLTLFGPPIVGAVRMVDCARAGELVVNFGLGQLLSDQINEGIWGDLIELEAVTRGSKEYPESDGGLEAYLLRAKRPDGLLRASAERLERVKAAISQLPYDPTDGATLMRV
jgi:class 3 adenylate cyclase